VNLVNLKDVIATIYKNILNSSVSVDLDEVNKTILVKDNDCPLCKYIFDDIDIAGCELISALVAEFINKLNERSEGKSSLRIESLAVEESRTMGHNYCVQSYKYQGGVD
jgi:hypothetical protein